jgi:hypothetical protein
VATGTPIAELILQDVETTLAAITEGPDYFTTINRVDRIDAGFPEVREPPQIFLGLGPQEMSDLGDDGTPHYLMRHFLNLEVQFFLRAVDDVALKLQRAIRDVVHALKADETRGGCHLPRRPRRPDRDGRLRRAGLLPNRTPRPPHRSLRPDPCPP